MFATAATSTAESRVDPMRGVPATPGSVVIDGRRLPRGVRFACLGEAVGLPVVALKLTLLLLLRVSFGAGAHFPLVCVDWLAAAAVAAAAAAAAAWSSTNG